MSLVDTLLRDACEHLLVKGQDIEPDVYFALVDAEGHCRYGRYALSFDPERHYMLDWLFDYPDSKATERLILPLNVLFVGRGGWGRRAIVDDYSPLGEEPDVKLKWFGEAERFIRE